MDNALNINSKENPFYRMIECLVNTNEVVLYGRIDQVDEHDEQPVVDLLKRTYEEESIGYPFQPPPFDEAAANWSSKILFYTAQLVMYREHDAETLTEIITPFEQKKTASTILTADLALRFMPSLLSYLKKIDVDDELIPLLDAVLKEWHYSGLLSNIELEESQFTTAYDNPCLLQLYVDRVIEQQQQKIGQMPKIKPLVMSAIGNYEQLFWKDFNAII